MLGVAAAVAALAAALSQHSAPSAKATLAVLRPPDARIVVVAPASRRSRTHSCSAQRSQPAGAGRKVLPVACEQPPRSNVTVPNAATGGLSPLLGG